MVQEHEVVVVERGASTCSLQLAYRRQIEPVCTTEFITRVESPRSIVWLQDDGSECEDVHGRALEEKWRDPHPGIF